MDDFNLSTLYETKNEYCSLLVTKLSPTILQGIYSIFKEAITLCEENGENQKYLMTFQNFLGRVPRWNQDIVTKETERIRDETGCSYLDDLLTCVHIAELKSLTSIRVGQQQRKIDIDIPSLAHFIHQVYIAVARKFYKNVYLFDQSVPPLQKQKNLRESEIMIRESILDVIRANMPVEAILRRYLDETMEDDVEETREEVQEETTEVPEEEIRKQEEKLLEIQRIEREKIKRKAEADEAIRKKEEETRKIANENAASIIKEIGEKANANVNASSHKKSIGFNDEDSVVDYSPKDKPYKANIDKATSLHSPKDIETIERINAERRRREAENTDSDTDTDGDGDGDDGDDRLQILGDASLDLNDFETIDVSTELSKSKSPVIHLQT